MTRDELVLSVAEVIMRNLRQRKELRQVADAAIDAVYDALREPTEEMLEKTAARQHKLFSHFYGEQWAAAEGEYRRQWLEVARAVIGVAVAASPVAPRRGGVTMDSKAEPECIDHLEFTNGVCPDCGLEVDGHGNTEAQFDYCSFPDCGCDGARLCDAKEGASSRAVTGNVEGMWSGRTHEQRKAVFALVGDVKKEGQ